MKNLSKKTIVLLSAWGFISVLFFGTARADDPAPGPSQGVRQQDQQLSDELKARVVAILSQYNPSSLTVEDAKAINNAFREAGIRRGPGQREAIEAAGFDPGKISALDPPPNKKRRRNQSPEKNETDFSGENGMTIEQTLSDQAQRTTIAFDALAFLTGDLCSDSFLPPGKVADFSGFQYLRDNDPTGMGHNTDFVTIIAFNILSILSESQIGELVALAQTQTAMINEHGYKRFPLMQAFRRLLEGDIPDGSEGLSRSAVMAYSSQLYRLDGQISYDRAETLGRILRNLTSEQQTALESLKALNGIDNWDKNKEDPLRELYPNLSHDEHVAVMTYASEIYSWYAGSVTADTYFCPERQGTYFGSFYMKDMPAMGNPNFTIPDNLTADMGNRFLGTLTNPQAEQVTGLVDIQREDLYDIVETRSAISILLRLFMVRDTVDEDAVLALAERYGELDGEIVYNYATHFASVGAILSDQQAAEITAIREEWNTIPCSGAYLYSESIDMPEIMNTDSLFGATNSEGPVPDIKANGQDGSISVSSATPVSITVTLDPGDKTGQNADWWIAAYTTFAPSSTWWSYIYPSGWVPGLSATIQTPISDLSTPFEVLHIALPLGDYTFYFAVDDNSDGVPDATWFDSVEVHVQ